MIEFILWTVGLLLAWALVCALFVRPKQPAINLEQLNQLIMETAARECGVSPERFREMLAEEAAEMDDMRVEEHDGFTRITNHRRRANLKVVK